MNTYERHQTLLELLRKQPGLRVPEIAQAIQVSQGTVRNNLIALEGAGHLTRVHGGAVLTGKSPQSDTSFDTRFHEHRINKLAIARTVSALVEDGASLLLDASSTV